ncbi:MAG: sugar phosphate isomerase/epimerase [Burkholderiales bacterium]|nr:sugar phosphate isomerase/epimerase [Burkholderiales bacterium]MDE2456765.1 sugar phosphate isomerase/epimerase [Burkholderiales bacterium]
MMISTFSYLWSKSAIDAIAELSRAGYREFEVPISAPHCWPADMAPAVRSQAKRRLQDCAARVRSLNAGGYDINLASPAANMRRKSIDHIKEVMDLAFEWGSTEVVISPGTRRPMISPPLAKALDWLNESLEVLLPRAEQAGVRLLLENTPYCFLPTLEEMTGVVKRFRSDRLKIVYDVANAAYIDEDPVQALRAGSSEVVLVHISDTGREVWGHDPIGTGVIDFEALGKVVDATCKTENAVLEIIREKNPLTEMHNGISELEKRGWSISL